MKRKVISLILALIGSLCLCVGAACTNTQGSAKPISITIDRTQVTVDEDNEVILIATTENFDGEVVWSTSDATIATVTLGIVTGVNPGTATITAKAGDKSATCAVTVTDVGYVPSMSVGGYTSLEIYSTENFSVPVTVVHKGQVITPDELTATAEDSTVATTDVEGSSVKITALAKGQTTVKVSATYRGKTTEKTIVVTVKENIAFSFTNPAVQINDGKYTVNVGRSEIKADGSYSGTVLDLGFSLTEGGVDKTDASTIEWSSSDNDVITVDGGVVTVCGAGRSTVTVKYLSATNAEYSISVDVNVKATVIELNESTGDAVTFEMKEITGNPEIVNEKLFKAGEITSVKVGEVDAFASANKGTNKVTIDRTKLETAEYGRTLISVSTEIATFEIEALICDKLIGTKEELESIGTISKVGNTDVYDGYYMLTANIEYNGDFTDYSIGKYVYSNMDFGLSTDNHLKGFVGTFDGDGHYIKGIQVGDPDTNTAAGFFGLLGTGSVVKNVAFLDAKLRAVKEGDMHGFLAHRAGATTVDNVLITGSVVYVGARTTNHMLFGYSKDYAYKLSNSVIQMTHVYVWTTLEKEQAWGCSDAVEVSTAATYSNVHANSAGKYNGTAEGLSSYFWNTTMWKNLSVANGFDARYWNVQSVVSGNGYAFTDATFLCFNNCSPYVWVQG